MPTFWFSYDRDQTLLRSCGDMSQPTAIVIGIAVGILARWLLLRRAPGGLPVALLLGVAGSMFTAFLMRQMDIAHDLTSLQFLLAVAGGGVLLLGYRLDLARQANRHLIHPHLT